MTLLTEMLERPLDPGYQEAADRRAAAGLPRATSTRTILVIVMVLLTGFLFAVGAKALRPKPTAAAAIKTDLVERIEALQAAGAAQEAKVGTLAKEVQAYESLALQQSGRGAQTDRTKVLEAEAGVVPLTGPGLTLTLDDASTPGGDADAGSRPSSGFASGRVTSADLQIVVNGLWASGAEAISINGHRLSSTAAIRFAGQAIIVDFRPVAPPYVITALGDADRIRALFEPSFAGLYLAQLGSEFRIPATWATSSNLRVPGDSSARVSVARPLSPDVGSPSGGGGPPTPP